MRRPRGGEKDLDLAMIGGTARAVKAAHFRVAAARSFSKRRAEGLRMALMRLVSERQVAGLFSSGKSFLLRFSALFLREGERASVGGRGGHEEPIGLARRASGEAERNAFILPGPGRGKKVGGQGMTFLVKTRTGAVERMTYRV